MALVEAAIVIRLGNLAPGKVVRPDRLVSPETRLFFVKHIKQVCKGNLLQMIMSQKFLMVCV